MIKEVWSEKCLFNRLKRIKMIKLKYIFIILFQLIAFISIGQMMSPNDPGGDPQAGGDPPLGGGAPIGSGTMILIGLSVVYGGKKVYDLNKDKEELEE